MLTKEIMTKNPACCTADSSLQDVAKMMIDNDCGCIPVVEDAKSKKPVGMITDRDIVVRTVAAGKNPLDLTASDAMSKTPIVAKDNSTVEECCNLMEKNKVRRIAVVDADGACCGMVSQADIAINASEAKTAEVVQKVSKAAATATA